MSTHILNAGEFLESPAASLAATVDLGPVEFAGTQSGRYKLLQQIGEGGFAVVFMAEQDRPVRRRAGAQYTYSDASGNWISVRSVFAREGEDL